MHSPTDTASKRLEHLPDALYILRSHSPTTHPITDQDILAPRPFTWNDMTSTRIRAHLSSQSILSHTSPFLSTHPNPSQALACLPLDLNPGKCASTIDVVKMDARKLRPAWSVMRDGDRVPIWVEQDACSQSAGNAFEPSYWICVDEVSDTFVLENGHGEWLACGRVPARMICTSDVVTEMDLDLWMEIAKRPSVIANRKAHTIALDVVPERKSSLAVGRAVKKGRGKKMEGVGSAIPKEVVEQRKQAQTTKTPSLVPTRPPLPIPRRTIYQPRHLSEISEDVHDGENCELDDAQDLPPTITTRIPKVVIRPPTPDQQTLSHTVVDSKSLPPSKSAARLAQLSELQSTSAALKILVAESRVKHKASTATSRQKRDATNPRRDIWARNHDGVSNK